MVLRVEGASEYECTPLHAFLVQPNSFVAIRPASRLEANPALQNPQFSSCTMPFIMVTDWPYNMGE